MKFEIRKSKWRQRFYVRIVSANGEPLFHSENYADKRDAVNAADLVMAGARYAELEDLT